MVAFLTSSPKTSRREARKLKRQMSETGEISAALRLLAPWLLLLLSIGVAPLAWLLTRARDVQGFTATCVIVCGALLVWSSLYLNRGRLTFNRVHEALNFAAPTGVTSYTILQGPDTYVMIGAFTFGMTSAIIWHKRHTSTTLRELERRGHGGGGSAEWRGFVQDYMPSIADSELTVIRNTPVDAVAGLQLGPGEVPDDLSAQLIDRITKFFGGIRGGTTLAIGDHLDKVGVHVMKTDPLRKPFDWQGPSAPGESIVELVEGLGRYRDNADLSLVMPYVAAATPDDEDVQQSHLLMVGMSRAGKGDAGELIDCNVACRADAGVVVLDAVKGDQQLGVIGDGAVYVVTSVPAIRSFMWKLVNVTIPNRAAFLGDPRRNPLGRMLREWVPGCGLTWLQVHAYEAAALYGNADLVKITERAASVGIKLIVEAQRGVHDRVDTNVRSNAADLIMFGCNDADDAKLVMPPELVDMGAQPWVWKNRQPGMCYTVLGHLPLNRQVIPARFARRSRDGSDVAAALAEYRPFVEAPLDPITAASWGEPYAKFDATRQAERDRRPRQHAFAGPPAPRYADPYEQPPAPAAAPAAPPAVPTPPAAAAAPPVAVRRSTPAPAAAPADDMPVEGFDLGEGLDDELAPGPEYEADEVATQAENLVGDVALGLEGDPERRGVLQQMVDGLERMGRPGDDEPQGAAGERFEDIEFPPAEGDEGLQAIVDRDEAVDILLAILAEDIGEGGTFKPQDLYDLVRARARRSDSWVRHELKTLREWGCVRSHDDYGSYVVIHTQRGDRGEPTEPDYGQ
ncbi:hypothetical protein JOL79_06720 [Microbispora sp. RL4-1S]|uniref:Uncharacterized protein n=1 Tax=Microbispora oryzae TaxID=2806554 RepID=A0A940WDG5_9ACTN|nr:hypothetical protein [Microbispora oryzae]MBP2703490.1 hypothetical protein [Microbispora oryzae]